MPYKSISLTDDDKNRLDLKAKGLIKDTLGYETIPESNIKAVKALLKEEGIRTKNITFFADPGHGWAKVKRSELEKLGILDKITSYSYTKGEHVYLEEDCDLTTYVKALEAKHDGKIRFVYITTISNKRSRIRNYDFFESVVKSPLEGDPLFYPVRS